MRSETHTLCVLLQVHEAEVGRFREEICLREADASMQQEEIRSLQKQLSDGTSKVLSLNEDLTTAEDTHNKAVEVVLCIKHNHLEPQLQPTGCKALYISDRPYLYCLLCCNLAICAPRRAVPENACRVKVLPQECDLRGKTQSVRVRASSTWVSRVLAVMVYGEITPSLHIAAHNW